MKRRLTTLAMLLLLGAAINVTVAWGFSWMCIPSSRGCTIVDARDFWPKRLHASKTNEPKYSATVWRGTGINEMDLHFFDATLFAGAPGTDINLGDPQLDWVAEELAQQLEAIYVENNPQGDRALAIQLRQQLHMANSEQVLDLRIDAGWPLLSVRGWIPAYGVGTLNARPLPIQNYSLGRAFAISRTIDGVDYVRGLPYQPIWPGFALNTLFYAAVCWLLSAAPFVLRRGHRRRRGLCVHCGYDLRGRLNDTAACPECGHRHRCHGPER